MSIHSICLAVVLMCLRMPTSAGEPSWEGKTVILTRAAVVLQLPENEKIAPKIAALAKDLTFQVVKEEGGRLLVDSRRQRGWIAKSDAVPVDQAVAYFTERLTRNPKDSHALTARGVARASTNEADKARADFDAALALDPNAVLAYYHRANLAYGKMQLDTALADYNAVIQRDPAFDWAYHVRGWIYYRKKDYDRALADYETALRLAPTDSVFYRDRGNIALIRNDHDKALADYNKAIALEPAYAVPWLQRGKTWVAKKEYAKALSDYEKAVELAAKESYATRFYTTLALFRAGCPDAAYRDGKKALEAAEKGYELTKGPNESAALAAAYAELGQFENAVQWQTKALAAAPADEKEEYRTRLTRYQGKQPYRLE